VKLVNLVAVGFLAVGTLACSGMMPSDPLSYMPEASLVDPWAKMGLPLDGGKVTQCDDKMVTVMYSGSKVDDRLAAFTSAIEKKGFKKEMDVSGDPSTKSAIFAEGDKKLTLTVTTGADLTTVSLVKTAGG
jgi:hypothetical protein